MSTHAQKLGDYKFLERTLYMIRNDGRASALWKRFVEITYDHSEAFVVYFEYNNVAKNE